MICLRRLRICFLNTSSVIAREQLKNLQPIGKLRYSVKLEDRPKKPANSFLQFCKIYRPLVRAKYPYADLQEIGDRLGAMWLVAGKEFKLEFIEKSRQDFDEYGDKITEFKEQLSDVQREEAVLKRRKKSKRKLHRAQKDCYVRHNRPRRPQSPFLLFVDFKINRDQLSGSREALISELATEWKNLNALAKSVFIREYKKLFRQYESQLSKWEDEMVEIGRDDLLHSRKRINFSPNEKYILRMQKKNKDAKAVNSSATDEQTSSEDETGSSKSTDNRGRH